MIVIDRVNKNENVYRMVISDVKEISEMPDGRSWIIHTDPEGKVRSVLTETPFDQLIEELGL